MDPALIAFCGLLIGLALLVLEFFIPSGGMIFVGAVVFLLAGIWGAYKAWFGTDPQMFAIYIGMLIVLIPGSVGGGLYVISRTSLGDHVLLKAPELENLTGNTAEVDRLRSLIGQRGRTLGLLNPGGIVVIEGDRHHCESPGMLIDPNTEVEVVDVKGIRLVVRVPLSGETSQDTAVVDAGPVPDAEPETQDEESLDFDIPG